MLSCLMILLEILFSKGYLIERIKQLTLDIWRTSRNSEEILAEVTCTNDRLDKLEERVLNKIDFLYFKLIEKENDNEK